MHSCTHSRGRLCYTAFVMRELIANAIHIGLAQQLDRNNGYLEKYRTLEDVVIDGRFDLVELADFIIDVMKANAQ